jgi:hypothetical protein
MSKLPLFWPLKLSRRDGVQEMKMNEEEKPHNVHYLGLESITYPSETPINNPNGCALLL